MINHDVAQELVASNLVWPDRDVLSVSLDLVIWQVGTNDAIYLRDFVSITDEIRFGIARIRRSMQMALLPPQAFPAGVRDRLVRTMNDALRRAAGKAGIAFLDRHRDDLVGQLPHALFGRTPGRGRAAHDRLRP